ncbi:MAG: CRISPR-associated protein Cas4, partial [Deltaproteobacteria bacterium]
VPIPKKTILGDSFMNLGHWSASLGYNSLIFKDLNVVPKEPHPKDNCDMVQLCAQALCLEEMLDVEIPSGALFYGKTRRRKDVDFDNALRRETESAAIQLHKLIESRQTPPPVYTPKCKSCSFFHICLPKTIEKRHSVKQYLSGAISES